MNNGNCGIVGYNIYLPPEKISAHELSEIWDIPESVIRDKIGIHEKVVGQKEDHTIQMTLKTAQKCLEDLHICTEDVDLVIFNGEDYKEYLCYTVALKIIKELNLVNAWGFDIGYRCTATVLAIKLAKDIINSDENVNTVLICGGNTTAYLVDEQDKRASFMLPLAAGACSLIIKRNYQNNKILGSSILNNSKFIDDILCNHDGTEDPRFPQSKKNLWKFTFPNYEGMKRNLRLEATNYIIDVAKKAVRKSNLLMSEIDYVAITHINRKAHQFILNELGIDLEKSVYLEDYGHVGHVDNVLSIDLALQSNKIKIGDRILMIALGIGYSYGAVVIEWGEKIEA